jgi:regulator of protease activity HflC (stomatin/prohibitin superfamily)
MKPLSQTMSRESQVDNDCGSMFYKGVLWGGGCLTTALCTVVCPCCGPNIVKVNEGYKAAVLRYGKLERIVGPGTYFRNPCIEEFFVKSVKIVTLDVPPQHVITRDNVTVRINTVVFYQIVDIQKAVFNVDACDSAISNFAQSTIRTVIGENSLDDIFQKRSAINERLTRIIDEETEGWGIKVPNVEVKDISIPENMQRVLAATAEATREGRAKIITAEAELTAASTLAEAADIMSTNPMALQLRYFQTLTEIAAENNSTVIVPTEVFGLLGGAQQRAPHDTTGLFDLKSVLTLRRQIEAERTERIHRQDPKETTRFVFVDSSKQQDPEEKDGKKERRKKKADSEDQKKE